eukprot:4048427-Amphidinium_carterae.4
MSFWCHCRYLGVYSLKDECMMTAAQVKQWWRSNNLKPCYDLHAAEWTAPAGWQMIYINSTINTMNKRLKDGDLETDSPLNQHFPPFWTQRCSLNQAINGFAKSVRLTDMVITNESGKLTGLIRVLPSLRDYLQSEACVMLTRKSISHFESFMTTTSLEQHGRVTIEMARGLLLNGVGSNKIQATITHQTPEVAEVWAEFKAEIMNELKKEVMKEMTAASSRSAMYSCIQAQLYDSMSAQTQVSTCTSCV